MPTLSVTIERETEKKFEMLLSEFGYEFSKQYEESNCNEEEVSFVLTSEQEFDLVELGILNEFARQSQKLEEIEMENYKQISKDRSSSPVKDKSLLRSRKSRN